MQEPMPRSFWRRKEGKCYSIMANPVFEAEDVVGCVVIVVDVTEKEQRDRLRRNSLLTYPTS